MGLIAQKFTAALITITTSMAFAQEAADAKPDPNLTEVEREEMIRLLDESFDMLLGLITGLTEEQWTFKQNDERWSVGECAEHIVRSERALLDYAKQALDSEPNPNWAEATKGKTDFIRRVMPNRNPGGAGGAQAPMEIRPSEKWDRGRAIEEFYKVRGEVRAYFETLDKPVKQYTAEHPFPIFGTLNAHDWLIYVPLHTIRHSRQIIEVKEDPNYPKS